MKKLFRLVISNISNVFHFYFQGRNFVLIFYFFGSVISRRFYCHYFSNRFHFSFMLGFPSLVDPIEVLSEFCFKSRFD